MNVVATIADLVVLAIISILAELARLDDLAVVGEDVVGFIDEIAPLAIGFEGVSTRLVEMDFFDVLTMVELFAVLSVKVIALAVLIVVCALAAAEVVTDACVSNKAMTEITSRLNKPAMVGRNIRRISFVKLQKGNCFSVRV